PDRRASPGVRGAKEGGPGHHLSRFVLRTLGHETEVPSMRKLLCVLTLAALALPAASHGGRAQDRKGHDKPEEKKVKELMGRKLDNAQKLLEALALNDLDRAAKHSEELIKIRKEAAWKIVKTTEYEIWSDEFDRAGMGIIKAAKDK